MRKWLCKLGWHHYTEFREPPMRSGAQLITWRCSCCRILHPDMRGIGI
jgi:hypothetical protein